MGIQSFDTSFSLCEDRVDQQDGPLRPTKVAELNRSTFSRTVADSAIRTGSGPDGPCSFPTMPSASTSRQGRRRRSGAARPRLLRPATALPTPNAPSRARGGIGDGSQSVGGGPQAHDPYGCRRPLATLPW